MLKPPPGDDRFKNRYPKSYSRLMRDMAGLVAYWRFRQLNAFQVIDELGGHHGTQYGESLPLEPGPLATETSSRALPFATGSRGSPTRVEIPNSPAFETAEFSCVAWVKATPQATPQQTAIFALPSVYALDSPYAFCAVLYVGSHAAPYFAATAICSNGLNSCSTPYNYANDYLNRWALVAVTWDSSRLRVYLNGDAQTASTPGHTSPLAWEPGSPMQFAQNSSPFVGAISEAAWFNRPLAPYEIQLIYNRALGFG